MSPNKRYHRLSHSRVACKQPCNRKLPCGHGCSELCSDRCRCGQQCKYDDDVNKKKGPNFVTLDKFLGSEAETSDDEALTASVTGEDAADLISTWGDDASGFDRLDSSGTDVECNQGSVGNGSDEYNPEKGSPITADCSSGYPTESPSLSGWTSEESGRVSRSWSTWNAEADDYKAKQAINGQGRRKGDTVFKRTWHEVRVGEDCRRERVGVHRSTDVHGPPEPMKSVCGGSTPTSVGESLVLAQEPVKDALIDVYEAPVHSVVVPASSPDYGANEFAGRNSVASKYEALGLWEQVTAWTDAAAVADGGNALNGVWMDSAEEDSRSEVSDLIKF